MDTIVQTPVLNIHVGPRDETQFTVMANSPVCGSLEWWFEVEKQLPLTASAPDSKLLRLVDSQDGDTPPEVRLLVDRAWEGMQAGRNPDLCEEGVGGTYFMPDRKGKRVAVFKPQDEEPFNVNNPKGYRPRRESDAGIKHGILVGEASVRECAAYLLDYGGFSGVPATALCLGEHPAFNYVHGERLLSPRLRTAPAPLSRMKLGSFQKYEKHDGDTEDIPPALLSRFPVFEVHKIAILDIRMCNTDRHGGNILWRESKANAGSRAITLIPIDHGYTLPSDLTEAYFCWLIWPQAKHRFDERTKAYIKRLDAEADIHLLKSRLGRSLDDRHCRVLRICTMLLKIAAGADLTPHLIGEMMSRVDLTEPCLLEQICAEAERHCNYAKNDVIFLAALKPLIVREVSKIAAIKRPEPSPPGSPVKNMYTPTATKSVQSAYGSQDLDEADLYD